MIDSPDMFPFYMFLGFVPFIVAIVIIVGIVVFIVFIINHNHNTNNNMDSNQMKPKTTAGDFLLNLGAIIALYTVVSFLLALIFTVINKAYPKITNGYDYYYSQSISWPVSILIVLFPIFAVIMWFLEKSYTQDPEKRNIGIHKWLAYITLFIGGIVLIGDLITVLYYFIDGQELTVGFLLKILSILVITLIVFLYYIADVRNILTPSKKKIWLAVSTVAIMASIIWGFSVLGSPRTQQLLKYDQQKVSDLQNINSQIEIYFDDKEVLPRALTDISNFKYYNSTTDKQTKKPYEYIKTNEVSYQLCAEFNKASDDKNNSTSKHMPYYDSRSISWTHPAGRYCFSQTVTVNSNTRFPYSPSLPVFD